MTTPAKYSRDNFRGIVEGLKSVRDNDSPTGLSNQPFLSFYYLDYQTMVRDVTFDQEYTITQSDIGRLPTLAYKFWKDVRLWWYLAYSNGIVNPWADMYAGQVLRVASQSSIDTLFAPSHTTIGGGSATLP